MRAIRLAGALLAAAWLASGVASAQSGDGMGGPPGSGSGSSAGSGNMNGNGASGRGSFRNSGEGSESGVGATSRGKNHDDTNGGVGAGGGVVLIGFDIYAPQYGYYGATYRYGKSLRCYSDDTSVNFSSHYCNSREGGFNLPNDDSDDRGQ